MSGCACVYVEHDDCGIPTKQEDTQITATAPLRCCECDKIIMPGEVYEYHLWAEELENKGESPYLRGWHTYPTCLDCVAVRQHFFCGPWALGGILYDLVMHFQEEGESVCCYDGLPARAMRVLEEVVWPRLSDCEEELAA